MANTSSSNKRNAAGNDHILTISPYWLPEQIFSDSVTAEGNPGDNNATRTSKRSESGSRTGGNIVEPDLNVCFFRELIEVKLVHFQ